MSPRRILFVELNEDGTTGGSHQALLDLVTHLDRRRFEPVVLFYQANPFVERLRAAGVEVLAWDGVRRGERAVRGPWWMPWRAVTQLLAIGRRLRLLRRERIALVHVNNSPSFTFGDWLPAARLARIPCVSHVRGELADRTLPGRLLIPRFDRLVAISAYIEDLVRAAAPTAPVSRIYDGVDAAAVQTRRTRDHAELRRELGVPAGAVLAVMVGHLRPWKGQHLLLEAAHALAPVDRDRLHVAFVGAPDRFAPSYAAELRAVADAGPMRDRIRFLGPRADVPDLMAAADVVVHASTVPEPFGLVVVEAMALGRPLIASRLGGPGEIVTPETGWTFDPETPGALARCLEAVLQDPSRAADAGAAAIHRAEHFAIAKTVHAVQAMYEELLARRAHAAAVTPAVSAMAALGEGTRP